MDLGVLEERQRLPVPGHAKAQQQQGHAGASTGHSRFLCLPCRKAGEELKMHIFLLKYWLQCSPSGGLGRNDVSYFKNKHCFSRGINAAPELPAHLCLLPSFHGF